MSALGDYLSMFVEDDARRLGALAAEAPRYVSATTMPTAGSGRRQLPVFDVQVGYNYWVGQKNLAGPKLVEDGLYGAKTAAAVRQAAEKIGADGTSQRVSKNVIDVSSRVAELMSEGVARSKGAPALVSTTRTAPATTAPAPAPFHVKRPVLDLQKLLNSIGWDVGTVKPDGLFGPKTQGAWEQSAKKLGLSPIFKRIDGKTAEVAQDTILRFQTEAALRAAKKPARPMAPAIPPPSPKPGAVTRPVLELQKMLRAVGWTKLALDGLFGPATKSAWQSSAKTRNLPDLFERIDGKTAQVNERTLTAITSDAAKAAAPAPPPPAPAPAPAPAVGVAKPVLELQQVLRALGSTIKADGLFGPLTKGAWESQAKKSALDAMFVRIDGKTARVHPLTLARLKEDAAARKKAPKPTEAPKPAPAPTKPVRPMMNVAVGETQKMLNALGAKLVVDGLFGPKTSAAWAAAATARKLNPGVSRIDSKTMAVDAATAGALAAEAMTAPRPAPAPAPAPAAVTQITVAEAQSILNRLGAKLKADGLFGPATKAAWEKEANRRKLNAGVSRVDGRTMAVHPDTAAKLRAAAQGVPTPAPTPAPKPVPAGPEMATISVRVAQLGLNRLSAARLTVDGLWGPKTEAALKAWLKTQPDGAAARYTVKRADLTLPKPFANALATASAEAPLAPAPKPPPIGGDTVTPPYVQLISLATESVPVIELQHTIIMTSRAPDVRPTGTWDSATEAAFLSPLFVPSPAAQELYRQALPRLLSTDNRTIRMIPDHARVVALGEKLWQEAQARPPGPAPAPLPPPMPGPPFEPPPLPEPGPAPEPMPSPAPGPVPEPVPSEQVPVAAQAAWDRLSDSLGSFVDKVTPVAQAIEAGIATGGTVRPELEKAYDEWVRAADRLKQRLADIIEQNPVLAQAINATGPSVGFAGYSPRTALEAYFGELAQAAPKAVQLLREPFPGLSGHWAGLGELEQVAQAGQLAARIAGPLWRGLIELLHTPAVKVAGATSVGVMGLGDIINGETKAYLDHEEILSKLLAEGAITVEQYAQLKKEQPSGASGLGGKLIFAAFGLGAIALALKNKKNEGERHAARR